jgi:hypothetical protein
MYERINWKRISGIFLILIALLFWNGQSIAQEHGDVAEHDTVSQEHVATDAGEEAHDAAHFK